MAKLSILIPANNEKKHNSNYGRKFTAEHKKALSISHKGQISYRKGKKFVDEKVSKEKRMLWLKSWKIKNKEKLLLQSRASYKRNIDNRRKLSRDFYWENREKKLDRVRFKKYGITGNEFRSIVQKQNGKCPICNKVDKKNLSVDHDHFTGKVRGIICNECNMALGNVRDSIEILRALANYLEKYETKT